MMLFPFTVTHLYYTPSGSLIRSFCGRYPRSKVESLSGVSKGFSYNRSHSKGRYENSGFLTKSCSNNVYSSQSEYQQRWANRIFGQ
jgi:hypothetical protein